MVRLFTFPFSFLLLLFFWQNIPFLFPFSLYCSFSFLLLPPLTLHGTFYSSTTRQALLVLLSSTLLFPLPLLLEQYFLILSSLSNFEFLVYAMLTELPKLFHEIFTTHARHKPHAIAVEHKGTNQQIASSFPSLPSPSLPSFHLLPSFPSQFLLGIQWSYQLVNQLANQLAQELVHRGCVQPQPPRPFLMVDLLPFSPFLPPLPRNCDMSRAVNIQFLRKNC